MKWNDHSVLEGSHAWLGASNHSWLNYSDDKIKEAFTNSRAKERGTEQHEFAAKAISLGIKVKQNSISPSYSQYINDAIGFKMDPEVMLFYNYWCYGTADAISFKKNKLRIHDLKTGTVIEVKSFDQLIIYAALFCLEYDQDPRNIETTLRIYQYISDKPDELFKEYIPDPEEILNVMDKIKHASIILNDLNKGE